MNIINNRIEISQKTSNRCEGIRIVCFKNTSDSEFEDMYCRYIISNNFINRSGIPNFYNYVTHSTKRIFKSTSNETDIV